MKLDFPLTLVLFIVSFDSIIEATEVGYGDTCDKNNLCNTKAFLECDSKSSKCICQNSAKSFYDKKSEVCKITANELCSKDKGAQECISFSTCEESEHEKGTFRCKCFKGLTVSRGQCFVPHIGDCSKPEKGVCDEESFIQCNSGKRCTCVIDTTWAAFYEPATKSCAILEGATCKKGEKEQPCVEFAQCDEKKDGSGQYACACSNGIEGPTSNNHCVTYYGEKCGNPKDAKCKEKDYLECNVDTGKCECAGEYNWYDPESGRCTLAVGSPCTSDGQSCVPRAYCSNDTHTCTCEEGLYPNKDKQCFLKHGAKCDNVPKGWECDKTNDLTCDYLTKTCDCYPITELHFEGGMCKLRSPRQCKPDTKDPDYRPCTENSVCTPGAFGGNHTCQCNDPLGNGYSGLCVLHHNYTCGGDIVGPCDTDAGEKCIDGRCACSDPKTMVYDIFRGFCALKMNVPCDSRNGIDLCEITLFCLNNGKCGCYPNSGLEDNGLGRCFKPYGAECEVNFDPNENCDKDHYHTCRNGKCMCNESHMAKEEGKGKPCVGNKDVECLSNENCNSDEDLVCKEGTCQPNGAEILLNNFQFILSIVVFSAFKLIIF